MPTDVSGGSSRGALHVRVSLDSPLCLLCYICPSPARGGCPHHYPYLRSLEVEQAGLFSHLLSSLSFPHTFRIILSASTEKLAGTAIYV